MYESSVEQLLTLARAQNNRVKNFSHECKSVEICRNFVHNFVTAGNALARVVHLSKE